PPLSEPLPDHLKALAVLIERGRALLPDGTEDGPADGSVDGPAYGAEDGSETGR
ncbi:hypothetical protein GT002_32725, partial [Streptomyces sp. SID4917]